MRGQGAPDVAAWQAGVFTAEQAVRAGLTRRQVGYRLRTGSWQRVIGRALSEAPRPAAGWPAETLAHAVALTWPEAVVGFQVAGALWGFPVPASELAGPIHVYSVQKHRARPGLVLHQHAHQPRDVARTAGGVAITSRLRTAIDCLSVLRADHADGLYAWLTTRGLLSHADLGIAVRELTGRHGVGALRRLHRRTAGGAVSEAERRAHEILRRAGITGWVAGARVCDADGVIGVADLLFPAERVVVEIDGRAAHGHPAQFEHDRRRQNRLMMAGYVVLRYTWHRLVTDPDGVAGEIRRTLDDRRSTRRA